MIDDEVPHIETHVNTEAPVKGHVVSTRGLTIGELNPLLEALGNNIKALRKSRGLTQGSVADSTGVKLKTLKNWEQKRRWPRVHEFEALATVLGVSPMELLRGEQDAPAPAAKDHDLAECLRRLTQAALSKPEATHVTVTAPDLSPDAIAVARALMKDPELLETLKEEMGVGAKGREKSK
jgi:transcriptional regulator with XRE-family HTH domain